MRNQIIKLWIALGLDLNTLNAFITNGEFDGIKLQLAEEASKSLTSNPELVAAGVTTSTANKHIAHTLLSKLGFENLPAKTGFNAGKFIASWNISSMLQKVEQESKEGRVLRGISWLKPAKKLVKFEATIALKITNIEKGRENKNGHTAVRIEGVAYEEQKGEGVGFSSFGKQITLSNFLPYWTGKKKFGTWFHGANKSRTFRDYVSDSTKDVPNIKKGSEIWSLTNVTKTKADESSFIEFDEDIIEQVRELDGFGEDYIFEAQDPTSKEPSLIECVYLHHSKDAKQYSFDGFGAAVDPQTVLLLKRNNMHEGQVAVEDYKDMQTAKRQESAKDIANNAANAESVMTLAKKYMDALGMSGAEALAAAKAGV